MESALELKIDREQAQRDLFYFQNRHGNPKKMINTVINQVFYDRCDVVEVSQSIKPSEVIAYDNGEDYSTGCFGVKPDVQETLDC